MATFREMEERIELLVQTSIQLEGSIAQCERRIRNMEAAESLFLNLLNMLTALLAERNAISRDTFAAAIQVMIEKLEKAGADQQVVARARAFQRGLLHPISPEASPPH